MQNSVFECILDSTKWVEVKSKLIKIIDEDKDSLRFYYLGNKYDKKVEHVGTKEVIRADEMLIF